MFKVTSNLDDIGKVLSTTQSVSHAIETPAHINQLMKTANSIMTSSFIIHMSRKTLMQPARYKHMYEWRLNGDPNSKLWKHIMSGSGANRVLSFNFKASKTTVPISDIKKSVGVQNRHIFYWKAMVLELGLPVRISPKLASALVLDLKNGSLVFTKNTIMISRQGNEYTWHSFTTEYLRWFEGGSASATLDSELSGKIEKWIKAGVDANIASKVGKSKTLKFSPVGLDKEFARTLSDSLRRNYILAMENRMVEDE